MAALMQASYQGMTPWSERMIADQIAAPGTLVATVPHAFTLARVTLDEAELLALVTDPAHRRCGHARDLMSRIERAAMRAGAGRMFLEVAQDNAAATALYAHLGYAHQGTRRDYYGPGRAALLMSRALYAD